MLALELQEVPRTNNHTSPGISSVYRGFLLNSNTYPQPIIGNIETFCAVIAISLGCDSFYLRHPHLDGINTSTTRNLTFATFEFTLQTLLFTAQIGC
jgi:hypothetical protein